MSTEKYEVLLRMRAIELLSYWEGRLVTNRLMSWFGISRQQASADIKRYVDNYNPGALLHSPAVKSYIPSGTFEPILTSGHINEYLDLLVAFGDRSESSVFQSESMFVSVQIPDRAVKPEVVRELLRACRTHTSLSISYASMSNPYPHERVISPHSLVCSGYRWHVRAYCHTRRDFRDFLLSRISGVPVLSAVEAPPLVNDTDWITEVEVAAIPNPCLNDAQKRLIEMDYRMADGVLRIRSKVALLHYTLQRYQIGVRNEDRADVRSFPVILDNDSRCRVEKSLFCGAAFD